MNNTAVKISALTHALSRIPEAELDSVMAYVSSILADSQVSKPENRSLKGIWAGLGFESIDNIDEELQAVRRELQEALLNRTFDDTTKRRIPGADVGLFTVPDDFDDPLPEEILESFGV